MRECVGDYVLKFKAEREREREPLVSAATQWVTELFKFIEKVPPFSATILCKESRERIGGTLTKSTCQGGYTTTLNGINNRPNTKNL